jgi:hypothetical protein
MTRRGLLVVPLAVAGPVLALLLASPPSAAQGVDEGELKAAIVYNLLLFVEWPPAVLPAPGGPLALCVGPRSAMHGPLQRLDRRELRGFQLTLRELGAGGPPHCHAVFVDAADRGRLAAGLKAQRAGGALVISDDPEAPPESTGIVLRRVGTRIAFDVNLGPLRQAGIQISSKLLRLARTVRE